MFFCDYSTWFFLFFHGVNMGINETLDFDKQRRFVWSMGGRLLAFCWPEEITVIYVYCRTLRYTTHVPYIRIFAWCAIGPERRNVDYCFHTIIFRRSYRWLNVTKFDIELLSRLRCMFLSKSIATVSNTRVTEALPSWNFCLGFNMFFLSWFAWRYLSQRILERRFFPVFSIFVQSTYRFSYPAIFRSWTHLILGPIISLAGQYFHRQSNPRSNDS